MVAFEVHHVDETNHLAEMLVPYLKPGMVLWLEGTLGAGKTTFTQALARAIGIRRIVKSPSYTIVREYPHPELALYHIDLYRLSEAEVADLYLEDYYERGGLTVIEWGSVSPDDLPAEYLKIDIETDPARPDERLFKFTPHGEQYQDLVEKIEVSMDKTGGNS